MPTICRLIQLPPNDAAALVANPASLPDHVREPKNRSDVYRYWDGIGYLLGRHRPDGPAARWLATGTAVSAAAPDVPSSRVLNAAEVHELDADLREIQPDDLIAHYDAAALDAAAIYPATWQTWEETFDPLGQMLEHYFFLQQFISQCAGASAAALFYFDVVAEGAL